MQDRKSNLRGEISFNGDKGSTARYDGCYIMEDGNLQPLFTVKEAITFAANLKLSSRLSYKEKRQKVIISFYFSFSLILIYVTLFYLSIFYFYNELKSI